MCVSCMHVRGAALQLRCRSVAAGAVARVRVRHEAAVGDLFGQALGLCADAGYGETRLEYRSCGGFESLHLR